jgi:acyl-CoA synthetase (NDP forming)
LSTSRLVIDHMEIKELDLNPVIVYEKGAKTVDARIILE